MIRVTRNDAGFALGTGIAEARIAGSIIIKTPVKRLGIETFGDCQIRLRAAQNSRCDGESSCADSKLHRPHRVELRPLSSGDPEVKIPEVVLSSSSSTRSKRESLPLSRLFVTNPASKSAWRR